MSTGAESSFELRSSAPPHAVLTLSPLARDGESNVELRVGGMLHAVAEVVISFERHAPSLTGFLRDMAADWRGWDGPREWESLEGTLHMVCRHDGLGHVTCRVALNPLQREWAAEADIVLDAGSLDDLAKAAGRLSGPPGVEPQLGTSA